MESSNYLKFQTRNPVVRRLIDGFYDRVREIVEPLDAGSTLDAGCGEGETMLRLGPVLGERVAGFDLDPQAVELARDRVEGAEIVEGSLYEIPFDRDRFDLVLCLEVLEHLEDPGAALAELGRASRRDVVVSVPYEPWFRAGSAMRGKYLSTLGNHPEHINHWNRRSFRSFLVAPSRRARSSGLDAVADRARPSAGVGRPMRGDDAAFDPARGQLGLERHFRDWFDQIDRDFRATSLSRLVSQLMPPGRVLDIGCGSGALSVRLVGSGREVVSQDPSSEMLVLCREHFRRLGLDPSGIRRGGVDEIPERDAFETVAALDVIEHIEDDRAALGSLRDALKPRGTLVVTVPALSSLYGPKDVEVGHYRRYDRDQLVSLLTEAGFQVDFVRWWNLIGVLPVWVSVRRGERLSEEFRYSDSPRQRLLNALLHRWFDSIENRWRPPRGLTLLALARPR